MLTIGAFSLLKAFMSAFRTERPHGRGLRWTQGRNHPTKHQGHQRYGGPRKLIVAARVFSDLLKPTFGPRGLDKMLYKTDGTTAVTNDGAKIVAELLVRHPAAKMMVSMAESQEEDCGDGVTTTMLLCGSLLIEANNLFRKGSTSNPGRWIPIITPDR